MNNIIINFNGTHVDYAMAEQLADDDGAVELKLADGKSDESTSPTRQPRSSTPYRHSPALKIILLFLLSVSSFSESQTIISSSEVGGTEETGLEEILHDTITNNSNSIPPPTNLTTNLSTIVPTQEERCSLIALLDFTKLSTGSPLLGQLGPSQNATSVAWSHLVAAQLAVNHFNERNPVVIKELPQLTQNCSLQLNIAGIANAGSKEPSVAQVLMEQPSVAQAMMDRADQTPQNNPQQQQLCAIVGPATNIPTSEAGVIAKGLRIPIISNGADDTTFAFDASPFTLMTSVNLHPVGEALVHWLRLKGRSNFLATLHDTSPFGAQAALGIENGAKESIPPFTHLKQAKIAPPFTGYEPNRSVRYALEVIKATTYRTIVVAIDNFTPFMVIADEAEALRMNGDDYVWVFLMPRGDNHLSDYLDRMNENQNATTLLNGGGVFHALDGFDFRPRTFEGEDGFLKAWKEINNLDGFIDNINNVIPPKTKRFPESLPENYFQTHNPHPGSGFMYDAVMLAGLGKCKQQQEKQQHSGGGKGPDEAAADIQHSPQDVQQQDEQTATDTATSTATAPAVGESRQNPNQRKRRRIKGVNQSKASPEQQQSQTRHLQKKKKKKGSPPPKEIQPLLDTAFTGATGKIEFTEKRHKRNRQRNTITWGMYNIREMEDPDEKVISPNGDSLNNRHWFYLTDILQGSPVDGTWTETEDGGPFLFKGGSSTAPLLLHDPPNQNYLSKGVRIFGLVLMALSLFLSFATLALVYHFREARTIKRYQPEFLYLLLAGAIIMSSSILFISQDESNGWSDNALDAACMTFPWLLVIGYITIFSALAIKLWRLHQVLQATRRVVKATHVTAPYLLLLMATTAVLLTWTIYDPYQWERTIINEETMESYGQCQSDHALIFVGCLFFLMVLPTITAATMSWKTKDVDENFSEARWIFYALVLQCQVLLIGIPILIILEHASADATYLGRALLIWSIPSSSVLIIFGPKVHMLLFQTGISSVRSTIHTGTTRVTGVSSGGTTGYGGSTVEIREQSTASKVEGV